MVWLWYDGMVGGIWQNIMCPSIYIFSKNKLAAMKYHFVNLKIWKVFIHLQGDYTKKISIDYTMILIWYYEITRDLRCI